MATQFIGTVGATLEENCGLIQYVAGNFTHNTSMIQIVLNDANTEGFRWPHNWIIA